MLVPILLGLVGVFGLRHMLKSGEPRRATQDSRNLADLDPRFRRRVEAAIEDLRQQGIEVRVNATLRSRDTQADYRRRGVSQTEVSWHQVGLAVDVLPRSSVGYAYPGDHNPDVLNHEIMDLLARWGAAAKRQGLTWGGDWTSFPDLFHAEWHPGASSPRAALAQYERGQDVVLAA